MFFWKREKRDTKRIQAVSPWRILFGKGRRDDKNEKVEYHINEGKIHKPEPYDFKIKM